MAFFPLALLYAIVHPPVWAATVIPLYQLMAPPQGIIEDLFGYHAPIAGASKMPLRIASVSTIGALLAVAYSRGSLDGAIAYVIGYKPSVVSAADKASSAADKAASAASSAADKAASAASSAAGKAASVASSAADKASNAASAVTNALKNLF